MIPSYLSPLANHLWQSTLFAFAAGLLTLAFRRNRSAVRHWLWLAASMKFLIPFALLVSFANHFQWRTAPAVGPQIPFMIEEINQPFAAPMPATLPDVVAAAPRPDRTPMVPMAIWLCGFVICVFGWLKQWRRVRTALRQASVLDLGLPIRVVLCPARLEPGVFGIIRPILMLPEGITDHLTPDQLQAILGHELCHVRRRDNLAAALHMIVEAIFWFYPLVWWIETRLLEEQENACDEEVLRLGSDPQTYAEGILKVCEFYLQQPVACVSGVTGADLKKRIGAIMKRGIAQNLNFGKKLLLATAGMVAVGGPIVVGLLNAPQIQAQSPTMATPKWEVASIKPCSAGDGTRHATQPSSPGRLTLNCQTAHDLIQLAHVLYAKGEDLPRGELRFSTEVKLRERPIEGGPAWTNSDRYQITAKAEGIPSQAMMQGPMLQKLLEDRFKLKVHRGTRDVPVYALTVAQGGSKLQVAREGSCLHVDPDHPPTPEQATKLGCGFIGPDGVNGIHTITNMEDFCVFLTSRMDRNVINKTGIAGLFDIHLELSPADRRLFPGEVVSGSASLADSAAAIDPAGTSVFTAVQKLGLKLQSTKGPIDYLVIDHVEKPTENDAANVAETPLFKTAALTVPMSKTASVPQAPSSSGVLTVSDTESRFLLGLPNPAHVQSPAPDPSPFETATVEVNHSGLLSQAVPGVCHGSEMKTSPVPPGRCTAKNLTLKTLVGMAYGVRFPQTDQVISAGPQWIDTDRYDIDAKAPEANAATTTTDQLYLMLRGLLVDRFKLKFHHESRDVPGYVLVVAANGPKLRKADDDERPFYGNLVEGIIGKDAPIGMLALLLGNKLGIPVLDRTQLKGDYDFSLSWDSIPSLLTTVQEQLGLKLESQRIPLDVLVIDSAEKPLE